jgi:hypothetical protein
LPPLSDSCRPLLDLKADQWIGHRRGRSFAQLRTRQHDDQGLILQIRYAH